jgi:hypothetical protein
MQGEVQFGIGTLNTPDASAVPVADCPVAQRTVIVALANGLPTAATPVNFGPLAATAAGTVSDPPPPHPLTITANARAPHIQNWQDFITLPLHFEPNRIAQRRYSGRAGLSVSDPQ